MGRIIACEPNICATEIEGIPLMSLDEVLDCADILVVLVNHKQFLNLSPSTLEEKVIIDTRGIVH